MKIKVVENCYYTNDKGIRLEGLRVVEYYSKRDLFIDAILEYENDFCFENVIASEDYFDGECEWSENISFEIISKA